MDFSDDRWKDLTPILQDDGPTPLVPILYEESYKVAMQYCRALIKKKEYSQRALEVTTLILTDNASHYAVWKYRLDILLHLKDQFQNELIFLNTLGGDNPKSYQIWHQRQAIAPLASNAEIEIDFIDRMLDNDSKNYHAWSYRQWVVSHFNIWDKEMERVHKYIKADIRNNSAWNQRYFVFTQKDFTSKDIEDELKFAIEKINLCPLNESAWNYARGLLNLSEKSLDYFKEFQQTCLKYDQVRFALSILKDYYKSKSLAGEFEETLQKLIQIDPVRTNYYRYLLQTAQ